MDLYRSFYHWIESHGGSLHPHLQVEIKDGQRGLFATDAIPCHSALATIPWSLVINRKHPDLNSSEMLVFLLKEYQKKEGSAWFPWLRLLEIDEQANDFLNERMQLFGCVQSSTLGQALVARYEQLQEEHAQLELPEISLEVFCLIDHLIWSRMIDLPDNHPVSLVPLIDFANHR